MQMLLHLFVPKETQISRNVLEHVQQRYVNTAKKIKKQIKTDRSAKHIIIAMAFVYVVYIIFWPTTNFHFSYFHGSTIFIRLLFLFFTYSIHKQTRLIDTHQTSHTNLIRTFCYYCFCCCCWYWRRCFVIIGVTKLKRNALQWQNTNRTGLNMKMMIVVPCVCLWPLLRLALCLCEYVRAWRVKWNGSCWPNDRK